jgi:hypothetical protein
MGHYCIQHSHTSITAAANNQDEEDIKVGSYTENVLRCLNSTVGVAEPYCLNGLTLQPQSSGFFVQRKLNLELSSILVHCSVSNTAE